MGMRNLYIDIPASRAQETVTLIPSPDCYFWIGITHAEECETRPCRWTRSGGWRFDRDCSFVDAEAFQG